MLKRAEKLQVPWDRHRHTYLYYFIEIQKNSFKKVDFSILICYAFFERNARWKKSEARAIFDVRVFV